jgi:hypothetical protein
MMFIEYWIQSVWLMELGYSIMYFKDDLAVLDIFTYVRYL